MKKNLFLLIFFILLPVLSCEGRSLIVFDKTIHDFGELNTESTARYTFTFKNAGNQTLIIERIKAG